MAMILLAFFKYLEGLILRIVVEQYYSLASRGRA